MPTRFMCPFIKRPDFRLSPEFGMFINSKPKINDTIQAIKDKKEVFS